jgi:hypothetical protein
MPAPRFSSNRGTIAPISFNKGLVMKMVSKKADYFRIELPGLIQYAYAFCLTAENRELLFVTAAYNIGHIDKYFNENPKRNGPNLKLILALIVVKLAH